MRDFSLIANPRRACGSTHITNRCEAHGSTHITNPCEAHGFTLIEILVVVVILAVLAGTLTLAVGGVGGTRQLGREAAQMQALIGYACEQAELTGREIGLSLNAGGYRFSRLDRNDWLPFSVDELRPRDWLKGTDAVLLRDDRRVAIATDFPEKPQLVCFSSGELTPFRLELGLADLAQRLRLDGKPDGSVELAAVDTHAQ